MTKSNEPVIIESLRLITELVIWGDQHNAAIFQVFLEHKMLDVFSGILAQPTSTAVKRQLIQSVMMMVQNLSREDSLFYLLSHAAVAEVIVFPFDFKDEEELVAYYVSFLKTLSLRLDRTSIQFFFDGESLPLFSRALGFINSPEGMVRTSMRTLALNVLRVDDDNLRKFIADRSAVLFSLVVDFLRDMSLTCDTILMRTRPDAPMATGRLADSASEISDVCFYFNDIFALGIDYFSEPLADEILLRFISPSILTAVQGNRKPGRSVCPAMAIYVLATLMRVFEYPLLLDSMVSSILFPPLPVAADEILSNERLPERERTSSAAESVHEEEAGTERRGSAESAANGEASAETAYANALPEPHPAEDGIPYVEDESMPGMEALDDDGDDDDASGSTTPAETLDRRRPLSRDELVRMARARCETSPFLPADFDSKGGVTSSSLFAFLMSGDEPTVLLALVLLHAITTHGVVSRDLLERAYALPARLLHQSRLVGLLTSMDGLDLAPSHEKHVADAAAQDGDLDIAYDASGNVIVAARATGADDDDGDDGDDDDAAKDPDAADDPVDEQTPVEYPFRLVEALLDVMQHGLTFPTRSTTFKMAATVLVALVVPGLDKAESDRALLTEEHLDGLMRLEILAQTTVRGWFDYGDRDAFLDVFEDEVRRCAAPDFDEREVGRVLGNATFMLAPHMNTDYPKEGEAVRRRTGDLWHRVPQTDNEKMRSAIHAFLVLRMLVARLADRDERDERTGVLAPDRGPAWTSNATVELTNCDFVACSVLEADRELARYLIIHPSKFVLVEADPARLGWATVRLINPLLLCSVLVQPSDPRRLIITYRRDTTVPTRQVILRFDDHVRCLAAKQHLEVGRVHLRRTKLHDLATLLDADVRRPRTSSLLSDDGTVDEGWIAAGIHTN